MKEVPSFLPDVEQVEEFNAYQKVLREQIDNYFEGKDNYKSPDVKTTETVLIPSRGAARVPLVLPTSDFDFLNYISTDAVDTLAISIRSRYAQAPGLEAKALLSLAFMSDWDKTRYFVNDEGDTYSSEVAVHNYSLRDFILPAGSHLFRYYHLDRKSRIEGDDLRDAVRSGEIEVEGEEGENGEWQLQIEPDSGIHRLQVKVDPNSAGVILPDPKPFSISDTRKDFRNEIDTLLIKGLQLPYAHLVIAQTPKIKLDSSIDAELSFFVWPPALSADGVFYVNTHIASRLLDGGVTNHPVRVELQIAPGGIKHDKYVSMEFFRNTKP